MFTVAAFPFNHEEFVYCGNLVTAIPILPGAGSITGIVVDRDLNVAAP